MEKLIRSFIVKFEVNYFISFVRNSFDSYMYISLMKISQNMNKLCNVEWVLSHIDICEKS